MHLRFVGKSLSTAKPLLVGPHRTCLDRKQPRRSRGSASSGPRVAGSRQACVQPWSGSIRIKLPTRTVIAIPSLKISRDPVVCCLVKLPLSMSCSITLASGEPCVWNACWKRTFRMADWNIKIATLFHIRPRQSELPTINNSALFRVIAIAILSQTARAIYHEGTRSNIPCTLSPKPSQTELMQDSRTKQLQHADATQVAGVFDQGLQDQFEPEAPELPPTDGGWHAWTYLAAATALEVGAGDWRSADFPDTRMG